MFICPKPCFSSPLYFMENLFRFVKILEDFQYVKMIFVVEYLALKIIKKIFRRFTG